MAVSSRFAARSSTLLRSVRVPAASRGLTTRVSTTSVFAKSQPLVGKNTRSVRLFSSSLLCRNQTQAAPNAEAYIQSGVIKGAKNPVDVKKVLVIGSGGLSIGQAGEFDYSGWYPFIWK